MAETRNIPIRDIERNRGQLAGVKKNPRTIKDHKFDKLKKSIEENPEMLSLRELLVYPHGAKFVCIGGNMRLEACKALGYKEVPCKVIPAETPAETLNAYIIKDNAGFGDWNWDDLANEWDEAQLESWGVDCWQPEEAIKEDPEPPKAEDDDFDEDTDPIVCRCRPGDIWRCGEHRVMCGDSTNAEDVKSLMGGVMAESLFTSPPYGDLREYRKGKDLSVGRLSSFIPTWEPWAKWQCVNLGLIIREKTIVRYWDDYIAKANDCGLKLMAWNVWDKGLPTSIGQQKHFFPTRHEWIFVFGKDSKKLNLTKPKAEASINQAYRLKKKRNPDGSITYTTPGDTSHTLKQMDSVTQCHCELDNNVRSTHPAPFPVALPTEYILALTDDGDCVGEPFGGSGTTLVACEQIGRKARVMELDPHYCDVILARWEKLTGKTAELVENVHQNDS